MRTRAAPEYRVPRSLGCLKEGEPRPEGAEGGAVPAPRGVCAGPRGARPPSEQASVPEVSAPWGRRSAAREAGSHRDGVGSNAGRSGLYPQSDGDLRKGF